MTGAPNENSWQISVPRPTFSWLANEPQQIHDLSWQTENITITINLASKCLKPPCLSVVIQGLLYFHLLSISVFRIYLESKISTS